MALDVALMARARRTGETVLRTYGWAGPTLSLGRNQRARGLYDEEGLRRAGVDVVRRPTGGRALLHHREITYSVAAPVPEGESMPVAFSRINALLRTALLALGVEVAEAVPAGRARSPTPLPCFAEPAAGELVLGGRKLVGSAQWREDGAFLQHGSILVDDDQTSIPSFMHEPAAPPPPPATLRAALGRSPSLDEVHAALAGAVLSMADPTASALELDRETRRCADELAGGFRDPAWTWRR
jgi:lipoate-protein ligase A